MDFPQFQIPIEEPKKNSFLTVSQLTDLIRTVLETPFSNVLLEGEISNFRPNPSGHLYFVLKDSSSQISAVMFRGRASTLDFMPKDGMKVQVQGQISVYAARGNYQIIINKMKVAGAGSIMEIIEKRKQKLAAEGLFDQSRKRKLPFLPETVGIVTSSTGAAIRDILQIGKRRNDRISAIVFPTVVQGESAAASIVKNIKIANYYQMCDVLIVGRGGGSLEDLLPFSEESVVRAIAESQIPVVSAVGHEIDWALSDFAADLRAPTPSAAAELVFTDKEEILNRIHRSQRDLTQSITSSINRLKALVSSFRPENMETQLRRIQQPLIQRFDDAMEKLEDAIPDKIRDHRNRIQNLTQILENCNPQTVFDRGYSMVTDSQGKVIRNAGDLQEGSTIYVRPAAGKITAQVISTEN